MQSYFWPADERIPTPRFSIGDPVVHKVDELNRPGSDWYIEDEPPNTHIQWWYRGIITGVEWNCGGIAGSAWRDSGWVYKIRVVETDEPDEMKSGVRAFSEFAENELRRSRALLRYCCCEQFRVSLKKALGAIAIL
jgi:hypothetical protein